MWSYASRITYYVSSTASTFPSKVDAAITETHRPIAAVNTGTPKSYLLTLYFHILPSRFNETLNLPQDFGLYCFAKSPKVRIMKLAVTIATIISSHTRKGRKQKLIITKRDIPRKSRINFNRVILHHLFYKHLSPIQQAYIKNTPKTIRRTADLRRMSITIGGTQLESRIVP